MVFCAQSTITVISEREKKKKKKKKYVFVTSIQTHTDPAIGSMLLYVHRDHKDY